MSQLSAQSLATLCSPQRKRPMIAPFSMDKVVVSGKSWGLSAASYDVRIAHDLTLGINPAFIIERHILEFGFAESALPLLQKKLLDNPPWRALAKTLEVFDLPDNVVGYVCDKSTYARLFVGAFNTLFDPGFQGDGVLELVNFEYEPLTIQAGDPIVQYAFHWLDHATDRPYRGKYQGQKGIQPAILENT